ncbi:PREDICTED: uncharacterized protein LOC108578714 [Habropoda laboriosa]|uniref:uncharacterized protein LOC108578714 n=1 Tax=Habropoda laboriosa TaxID=597456 RepID=UPI00083D09B0|nr:PREDICTED: uncharacterized protein LOC108578714 [Habropoda laboriosa]
MRVSRGKCHLIYALLCVCIHWTIVRADNLPTKNWKIYDPEATETRHTFREVDDYESPRRTSFRRKLIPIKEPRANKSFTMLRLPLEPDAEMLPAHYTGVKPPGVDHMELKYAESQISKVVPKLEPSRKSEQADGTRQVSQKHESESEGGEKGYERSASFENARTGDDLKQKKKTQYAEAGGKKRVHDDRGNNSGLESEKSEDEYNKDHDFYDNDDHGGHSKKHGHYNEKHIAIEGTFKKGDARGSGFDQAELLKQGIEGNSQADRETKGHEAGRGYDGFFKNFQGFAKQGGRNGGRRFRFGQTKAR